MPRSVRLLSLCLLSACSPPEGSNGPEYAEASEGTGPCFEANLMDGLQDGDEFLTVFACFNQYGAFDELEPLVVYLAESEDVVSLIDAVNGSLATFDLVGALEMGARLIQHEDDPARKALALYTEAVDEDLLRPTLGVAREASDAMASCEEARDPTTCSVPRLVRAALDTDVPDQLGIILTAVSENTDEDDLNVTLQGMAALLYESSTLNPDKVTPGNDLLDLGRFLLAKEDIGDGGEPQSPLDRMLPSLRYLLSDDLDGDGDADLDPRDDNLLAAMAKPLAGLWRDGVVGKLPDDLTWLLTHDSSGGYVGWDGTNVIDELLAGSAALTSNPDMLYMEITLSEESGPTTILEFALDTLDALYLNGADVPAIVDKADEVVELMCTGEVSSDLCDLTHDLLPPVKAMMENTQAVPYLLLPLAYALHQTADVSQVVDLAFLALKLDLLGKTKGLLVVSTRAGTLEPLLDLLPVFINPELGRLTAAGEAAQGLAGWAINDWDPDGSGAIVPLEVPLGVAEQVLYPEYPNADLDFLLGTAGLLLRDEDSGLYVENLLALGTDLSEVLGNEQVDVEGLVTDLLDNEQLWTAGLRLGADPLLIDQLTPIPGRPGAMWYLYDLIAEGVLDQVLTLTAEVLDLLIENDILADPESSEP